MHVLLELCFYRIPSSELEMIEEHVVVLFCARKWYYHTNYFEIYSLKWMGVIRISS